MTKRVARPFKRKSGKHRLSLAHLRTMADAGVSLAVSDWLHRCLGSEPSTGDNFIVGASRFTVIQTRLRKAHRVFIEKV